MGHLLGAPPPPSSVCANPVSAGFPRGCATWIEVDSLEIDAPDPTAITAFAIDQPRPGDRSPGLGVEVNGWVIGRDGPVRGIRTSRSDQQGIVHPLGVQRPDVAADYPDYPHADFSGFSAWVSIDPRGRAWQIDVDSVLADGGTARIARIRGRVAEGLQVPSPGNRLVTAPDFVIIGTQRGGTTSLHAYLSAHPQVITPATKELHFLTDRHERGLDWYLGQFPAELAPARYHWRSDALRALSPVGATAIAGDSTSGKNDRVAAQSSRPGILAFPPGAVTRGGDTRFRRRA